MSFRRGLLAFLVLCACLPTEAALARPKVKAQAEGQASAPWATSDIPVLAEPMVFDLVRPLGDRQGQLEVNTLLQVRGTSVAYAPEAELMVADGHGLEVELPMGNRVLGPVLKLAYQGTLGPLAEGRAVHGLQGIAEWEAGPGHLASTGLYLLGGRLNGTFSGMGMFGLRHHSASGAVDLLANASAFADVTEAFLAGVELNGTISPAGPELLVMPQARWDLDERIHLQFGMGLHADASGVQPASATRISLDF